MASDMPEEHKRILLTFGFEVSQEIGRGANGKVYRGLCTEVAEKNYVIDESEVNPETDRYVQNENIWLRNVKLGGRECAIKWMGKTKRYYNEALALMILKHPNIVDVYGVFRFDGHVYICTEFIRGGFLLHLYKKYTQEQGLSIIQQLVDGLAFIHSHEMTHGDLKDTNILYERNFRTDEFTVKYIDFGRSTKPRLDPTNPERFEKRFVIDIKQLGVCLYKICNQTIFLNESMKSSLLKLFDRMRSRMQYKHMQEVMDELDTIYNRYHN